MSPTQKRRRHLSLTLWALSRQIVGRHFDGQPIAASITEVSHAHPPSMQTDWPQGPVLIDRLPTKNFALKHCAGHHFIDVTLQLEDYLSATNVSKYEEAVKVWFRITRNSAIADKPVWRVYRSVKVTKHSTIWYGFKKCQDLNIRDKGHQGHWMWCNFIDWVWFPISVL